MTIYYIFKFIRLWALFAAVTLLFSLLLVCAGHNIFAKAGKKASHAFIPIYNLIDLLDICQMFRIYFLLLLLPITNLLVIYLMLYRLSIVFKTSRLFAVGLIFLPVIFLPALNYGKLELKEEKGDEEMNKDVSNEMVSVLTESQFNDLNNAKVDTPNIDNVWKVPPKTETPPPTFKANAIQYKQIVLDSEEEERIEKIEKVEPVPVTDINSSKFITEKEEDDKIEVIDL